MNDAVRDSLQNIRASILLIQRRVIGIQTAAQLLSSADGLLTLDAVAMRLQIVGENVKNLASLDPELLQKYPEIEWDKIMRLRDIIPHIMMSWTMRLSSTPAKKTFLNCKKS